MRPLLVGIIALVLLAPVPLLQAQTSTSTLQSQVDQTNAQIAQLQAEIAQLQAQLATTTQQKQTLQTAINALNLNIQKLQKSITLTQAQMKQKDSQIQTISTTISTTTDEIGQVQIEVADSLRQLDVLDAEPLVAILLGGGTLSSFFDQSSALASLRIGLENKIEALNSLKSALVTNKTAAAQKRQELATLQTGLKQQQTGLTQTKASKTQLLQETNAQESTYEKLLAQAKAELASFSTFTQNAGGAGILTNQTSCDSWGCYYNQRDAQWGNLPLNGTKYLMKSDGCLVTAMAMVLTHLGYSDVTPATINSNPANFAVYEPAYLLFTIHVGSMTATRVTALINATLSTGNPVIVGLHAYGGTHFVVLTKGNSASTYLMRDPYIADGKDISFSAHYSLGNIYSIQKVKVSS